MDVKGRVCNARGRVSTDRFRQDILGGNGRQLRAGGFHIPLIGHHMNILDRNNPLKSGYRSLDQRVLSNNRKELLWIGASASGPESAPDSAGHDDGVDHYGLGWTMRGALVEWVIKRDVASEQSNRQLTMGFRTGEGGKGLIAESTVLPNA